MGWVDGLACSIKSLESYCKVCKKDICILALGRGWQLPWGKYFSPVIAGGAAIAYCRAFGILQEYSGCTEDSLALLRCHSWDERLLHLGQMTIPMHPLSALVFCSTSLSCWGEWRGMKQHLPTSFTFLDGNYTTKNLCCLEWWSYLRITAASDAQWLLCDSSPCWEVPWYPLTRQSSSWQCMWTGRSQSVLLPAVFTWRPHELQWVIYKSPEGLFFSLLVGSSCWC